MELYVKKLEQAQHIQRQYVAQTKIIIPQIKTSIFDEETKAVSNNFIYSGTKLAGQILASLGSSNGFLQLGIIGARTLFEMQINSVYIFKHPEHSGDTEWIKSCSVELLNLSSPETKNHTRFNNSNLEQRATQINLKYIYDKNYRVMSEWAHLMMRTVELDVDPIAAKKFGLITAITTLVGLHNIFDSIYFNYKISMDESIEESILQYSNDISKIYEPLTK